MEIANSYFLQDDLWPYLLKSYYYALYFLYIPTYTYTSQSVTSAFREAIKVMEETDDESLETFEELEYEDGLGGGVRSD